MNAPRRGSAKPTPMPFFRLVMASSVSVDQAAEMFGRTERTIRLWLERAPMGCRIAGGEYQISLPLLEAYVAGWQRHVISFLDGAPPSDVVREAFALHDAGKALEAFVAHRLRSVSLARAVPIAGARLARSSPLKR